jgi:hypothetical protein
MTKYKNIIIESTPTEAFPELVTLTKTPKNKKIFLGRKYINLTKAITAIDTYIAEELISKGGTKVKEELTELFGINVAIE